MAGEKFRLSFISDGFGKVDIDEPFGYNALSFDVIQKEKGYARDIFFNGGESQMEFTNQRNHYLDKLIYYNHYYGYESQVELEIEFSNGLIITHDIDFANAMTDDYEYFKCKMIQKAGNLIVKRKSNVKVDLFSTKDIYDKPINAIPLTNILIKPKSVFSKSIWQQASFQSVYMEIQGSNNSRYYQGNPCQIVIQSDINDSLSSLLSYDKKQDPSNYYIIKAKDTMVDTRVIVSGIHIDMTTGVYTAFPYLISAKGYVDLQFTIVYGQDEVIGTKKTFIVASLNCAKNKPFNYIQPSDFVVDIPLLQVNDKVWCYFEWRVKQTSSGVGNKAYCRTTITGMNITATSTTKSTYNSVTKGIRLLDAVKQVVKSISGLDVNAPIFDVGSDYYNTYLINGNLLRGITGESDVVQGDFTSGFYLSLDDISNSITECNADYEVNDEVFFGNERDFYTATECGFFDNIQFQEFTKTFNPRMSINQFSYKYKAYQALKENELPQTADTVHGESILTFFNKNVENLKELQVEWIRDAFLFEEARVKGLQLTTDTSYQNDDTVFALDTIAQNSNQMYNEYAELSHVYDYTIGHLKLTSTSINFSLLGMSVGTDFYILKPDNNAGKYSIFNITNNILELTPNGALPNDSSNGIRTTGIRYTISSTNIPLTNYTVDNITNIAGIIDPKSYSNLRFSIKRNIENYFNEYLATCNSFWSDQPIKTTWYKNNRDFTCTYNGLTTLEGADITPTNKILSPFFYQNVVFANVELEDFFALQNALRTDRGYVRAIDKNSNVIKLYPVKMSYKIMSKELTMDAEDKFEPSQMTITTANKDILINNETSVHQLTYTITDDKLFVYDQHRQLLYNGVFWDKVTINGANAKTISELDDLMKLVQSKNN